MGKSLIIKGADFSRVAVAPRLLQWAFGYSDYDLQQAVSGKSFFRPDNPEDVTYAISRGADSGLIGHTVRKVRLYAVRAGSLRLMRLDRDNFTVDCVQSLNIAASGIVEIDLLTPIPVDSSHTIGIGYTDDAATNYLENSSYGYSFDMVTLSTRSVGANNCTFVIDYAY